MVALSRLTSGAPLIVMAFRSPPVPALMSPRSSAETLGQVLDEAAGAGSGASSSAASSEPSSPSADVTAQVEDTTEMATTETEAGPPKRSALKRNGQPRKKKIRTYSRRKVSCLLVGEICVN